MPIQSKTGQTFKPLFNLKKREKQEGWNLGNIWQLLLTFARLSKGRRPGIRRRPSSEMPRHGVGRPAFVLPGLRSGRAAGRAAFSAFVLPGPGAGGGSRRVPAPLTGCVSQGFPKLSFLQNVRFDGETVFFSKAINQATIFPPIL